MEREGGVPNRRRRGAQDSGEGDLREGRDKGRDQPVPAYSTTKREKHDSPVSYSTSSSP